MRIAQHGAESGGGGGWEERKTEVKSSSLPNSFNDDCSMCTNVISVSQHFTPKILIANCRYVQSQDTEIQMTASYFLYLRMLKFIEAAPYI